MERNYLFNYDALDNYLNEHQNYPNRVNGELTMLRDNCKKYIKPPYDSEYYTISINDETLEITKNGQGNLEDIFKTLPTGYEMDNKSKLYHQVLSALDEANTRGIYDLIFKTKNALNGLKESVENPYL